MASLRDDIAAFERQRTRLEAEHLHAWAVFYDGHFVGVFPDFEAAASEAVERFGDGPYLIRQIGVSAVQLPGGMVFRPSHALDSSGL